MITIELEDSEAQFVVMALAHLAVERPGWEDMIRRFVGRMVGDTLLLDRFKALHEARRPLAQDAVMQLRQAVEAKAPEVWAMVQEVAWPK